MKNAGIRVLWPVEANLVFAAMPKALDAKLKAAGAAYYVRRSDGLPEDEVLVRMVTSFATTRRRDRTIHRAAARLSGARAAVLS